MSTSDNCREIIAVIYFDIFLIQKTACIVNKSMQFCRKNANKLNDGCYIRQDS